jgi:SSS family solute:Na+ symporter
MVWSLQKVRKNSVGKAENSACSLRVQDIHWHIAKQGESMNFSVVDYLIVALYLAGVAVGGSVYARKQKSVGEYFLGGRNMRWWSVGLSVVATETSTLTFISIPGLAYATDLGFLQLAFGFALGRLLVALIFIPAYYRGELETAYDFLGRRFGEGLRTFTSLVFIVTRVLASGVRLFAAAIPIHLITGLGYGQCILLVGTVTLLYTYLGGLRGVVAMDVVQMCIYTLGVAASLVVIFIHLPHGWQDILSYSTQNGTDKFTVIHSGLGKGLEAFFNSPYTLAGGLIGGAFLSMASHGTDHLIVQRLLGCGTARKSQKALLLDASLIVVQFALFLFLGLALYAFYGGISYTELGLSTPDEIFPRFIVNQLPSGLSGLLVAGVLASAMGTLSSTISSLSSSSFLDIVKRTAYGKTITAEGGMRWSRGLTLLWGLVLAGGAMVFTDTHDPVVELGLRIASVTYGGLLGTFLLGIISRKATQIDAGIALISGILVMVLVMVMTHVDFTWHTCIGAATTVAAGYISVGIRQRLDASRS